MENEVVDEKISEVVDEKINEVVDEKLSDTADEIVSAIEDKENFDNLLFTVAALELKIERVLELLEQNKNDSNGEPLEVVADLIDQPGHALLTSQPKIGRVNLI